MSHHCVSEFTTTRRCLRRTNKDRQWWVLQRLLARGGNIVAMVVNISAMTVLLATATASKNSFTFQQKGQREMDRRGDDGRLYPNILFIMTDQQRFDALRRAQDELEHYNGKTKIRTPNLDRLSREGVYFKTAYCQCSVCGPSRTSIRTGCTVERTGVQTNDLTENYDEYPFFRKKVEALRSLDHVLVEDYGYASEYYGKWHMPDVLYGYTGDDDEYSSDEFPSVIRYNTYDFLTDRFFFADESDNKYLGHKDYLRRFQLAGKISNVSKSDLEPGQQFDTYTGAPYTPLGVDSRLGLPKGTPIDILPIDHDRIQPSLCGRYRLPEQFTPSSLTATVAGKALRRLLAEQQTEINAKPFLLTVSFHNPHAPFIAADKHLQYYWKNRRNLLVPPSIADTMVNSAYEPISARLPRYRNATLVQEWTAVYYALVEEVDGHIGDLLQHIETIGGQNDQRETLVVFTSDHGEHLGAHGDREKNTFYEESSRVQLMFRFPNKIAPNTVIETPVTLLDLFSTILDYAVGDSAASSDGKSLRRFIEKDREQQSISTGSRRIWQIEEDVVVAEWDYRQPRDDDKTKFDRRIDGRPSFMIRYQNYKLMIQKLATSREMDMMFDLSVDPFEMNNLLGKNADGQSQETIQKAEHLRCLLLDWMTRMDGTEGHFSDPAANFHETKGDIEEVRLRQSWPALDFWIGPSTLQFGEFVWDCDRSIWSIGSFTKYLHIGKRTSGPLIAKSIHIEGKDARHFSVVTSDATRSIYEPMQCHKLEIMFTPVAPLPMTHDTIELHASLVFQQQSSATPVSIQISASILIVGGKSRFAVSMLSKFLPIFSSGVVSMLSMFLPIVSSGVVLVMLLAFMLRRLQRSRRPIGKKVEDDGQQPLDLNLFKKEIGLLPSFTGNGIQKRTKRRKDDERV